MLYYRGLTFVLVAAVKRLHTCFCFQLSWERILVHISLVPLRVFIAKSPRSGSAALALPTYNFNCDWSPMPEYCTWEASD